MKLYRPVGLSELALIFDKNMKAFPPRLPEQPIFYPVMNEEYAIQIAREWNAPDQASGFAGYVTEFEIEKNFCNRYPIKVVGTSLHEELWVPAEELQLFNEQIAGTIRVIRAFFGHDFTGFIPTNFGLKGKNARTQFNCLVETFGYSGMDFLCELSANRKAVFLNFPHWAQMDVSCEAYSPERKTRVLEAIQAVWNERLPAIPLCT